MLDKDGFIQESFFENQNNCIVSGNPFEPIKEDIDEYIKKAINNVESYHITQKAKTQTKLPCIEFAEEKENGRYE